MTTRPGGRGALWRAGDGRAAGIDPDLVCCHTFRATGVTNFLENGGALEDAAHLAAHASILTTRLYDRRSDDVDRAEVERIRI